MSPITQLRVCYIHSSVPYSSCMLGLHCVVWFPLPKTNLPLPVKGSPPAIKKVIEQPTWPTIPDDIISIHILNCCDYFCMINWSELVYGHFGSRHFSPLTHQSLTLTFTLNLTITLLSLLTPLQLPASIIHTSRAQGLKWPGQNVRERSDCTLLNLRYVHVDIDAHTSLHPLNFYCYYLYTIN